MIVRSFFRKRSGNGLAQRSRDAKTRRELLSAGIFRYYGALKNRKCALCIPRRRSVPRFADLGRFDDPADRDSVRRVAERRRILLLRLRNGFKRSVHSARKFFVDILFRPIEVRKVLNPFKIGNDNAAAVGEYVGNNGDTAAFEDLVGLVSRRAVRAFNDKESLYVRRVFLGYLIFRNIGYI